MDFFRFIAIYILQQLKYVLFGGIYKYLLNRSIEIKSKIFYS